MDFKYYLASGKNQNASWPLSHNVKNSTSWQMLYQLAAGLGKSSWLVKKNIWLVLGIKFVYQLSTNQLQDILFQIV